MAVWPEVCYITQCFSFLANESSVCGDNHDCLALGCMTGKDKVCSETIATFLVLHFIYDTVLQIVAIMTVVYK